MIDSLEEADLIAHVSLQKSAAQNGLKKVDFGLKGSSY